MGTKTVVVVKVPPLAEAASNWEVVLVSSLGSLGPARNALLVVDGKNTLVHLGAFSAANAMGTARFSVDVAQLDYNLAWDVETEILTLVVLANKPLVSGPSSASLKWELATTLTSTAATASTYSEVQPRVLQQNLATIRTKLPATSLGSAQDGTRVLVRARAQDAALSDVGGAEWVLPRPQIAPALVTAGIGTTSYTFEDGNGGKRLVLAWTETPARVEVSCTVLYETMAFRAVANTVASAAQKCVFMFGDGAGSIDDDGAPLARLPLPGTSLVCLFKMIFAKAVTAKRVGAEVVVP